MRAVNLLPKEAQKAAANRPWGPILVGGLLLTSAAFASYSLHSSAAQNVSDKQSELAQVKGRTVAKAPLVTPAQQAVAQQESPRISALDAAIKNRVAWDALLRDLSQIIPQDVHLGSLTLSAPVKSAGASTATASTNLTMIGTTTCQEAVARLLVRLQLLPSLSNVTLQSSTGTASPPGTTAATTPGGGCTVTPVSFTIVAQILSPQVAS